MPRTDLVIPGESAVVTASGSGIGRAIARDLATAGVNVVLNDVESTVLEEALDALDSTNGEVTGLAGDVSDPAVTEALIDRAVEAFGGLDILVNNVGIAGPTKPCEEVTKDEFMRTLEVNLGGHFTATQAAIPHLATGVGGRIVNLASMSGKRPLAERIPYTTSKMGVIGFTRTLAVELADRAITVNAICPGAVDGPRLTAVMEAQAESEGRPLEDVVAEYRAFSPMDEFVQASDITDTVLYLCSDRAERVTGQDLNVTAGTTMY